LSQFSELSHSYIAFNRAGDSFHRSGAPTALWELDGWWQPPDAPSPGGSSMGTTIVVIVCVAVASAFFAYRYASLISSDIVRLLKLTMILQFFFRLIRSRTSGSIEDDHCSHGARM
jgi:hypothetical protein